eukprot:TRINITY_DN6148_c0_g1_i1.p1 TRINITY_DN6148_c0_g1~~TRINITY_DN6148_c0_g1_i1.p1  ORF type:complete len:304 (-),score=52.30 TRINITY_DN6148_c0_g1_i1:55-966(-)
MVAQVTQWPPYFLDGVCVHHINSPESPAWEIIGDEHNPHGIAQKFEHADYCKGSKSQTLPSTTTIEFVCDAKAAKDTFYVANQDDTCDYTFTIYTKHACIQAPVDDCIFETEYGTFNFSPHTAFGTMGPIVDSSSIFSTYLSVCSDGEQICQTTPEMALRFQTPTFCSSVVGRWADPTWGFIDEDPRLGIRQTFENGDLCFGQVSTEPSRTTIDFVCDLNTPDTYTTTSSNFQCDWQFTVPSPYACVDLPCGDCLTVHEYTGCELGFVEECVCSYSSLCCELSWEALCVQFRKRSAVVKMLVW